MRFDSLVPPCHHFSIFLFRVSLTEVSTYYLHAEVFHPFLEVERFEVVDLSVVIAGGFQRCVSHFGYQFQCFLDTFLTDIVSQ